MNLFEFNRRRRRTLLAPRTTPWLCFAASISADESSMQPPQFLDDINEPDLLTDDLSVIELELRHRDAYLRSLGAPSAETVARSTLVTDEAVDRIMASEGALARLKDLYALNEDSEPSYELVSLSLITLVTYVWLNARYTQQERRLAVTSFIERNKATVFSTKQQASRRLTDYVTMRAFRFGWKRSIGSLVFMPVFVGGAQCFAAIRGKSSAFDYVPSGLAAGALVRGVHGLQPMFWGALLGGVIGAVFGSASYAVQRWSNFTYEEMRRFRLTERAERNARLMAKLNSVKQ